MKNKIIKEFTVFFILAFIISNVTAQTKYWDYPIKPGMEEWTEFTSSDEMVNACQIPNMYLETIPTDVLLDICLRYPMLLDVHFSNNLQEGIELILTSFNGLTELFKRPDGALTIYNQYLKETPCEVNTKKNNNTFKMLYLELLLSRKTVIDKLNFNQKDKLLEQSNIKLNIKKSLNHSQFYLISTSFVIARLIDSINSNNSLSEMLWFKRFNSTGVYISPEMISELITVSESILSSHE